MNNVKITIIAAIDQDLYREHKNKGETDAHILQVVKESISVDYTKIRGACIFDYQVESVEPLEENKYPSCGVLALINTINGKKKCLACENERKD